MLIQVGSIAVVDLEAALELYAETVLPEPLGRSRPVGSLWLASRNVEPIETRLSDGDLRRMQPWVAALVRPDVSVQCRVEYSDGNADDRRLYAVRGQGVGFVAVQRRCDGMDTIDVYSAAPDVLSQAVAESAGLVGAGTRWRIELADRHADADRYDDLGFLIPGSERERSNATIVDRGSITATGTLRVGDRFVQWVQIDGDGDYILDPAEPGSAEPLDIETMTGCVAGLIAADLSRR
ncbi:hypothetical protein [Mycolicibacterium bacteremicum]|uniref:hypothetical protein n=1 Tax=Mycolicibacterium bacteremicum TaxID=564198 RepID=UPI001F46FDAA|nr:hypothetical protein [Mycolicibacterium bacteremicum]